MLVDYAIKILHVLVGAFSKRKQICPSGSSKPAQTAVGDAMTVIDGDFRQTNKFRSSHLTPWYTKTLMQHTSSWLSIPKSRYMKVFILTILDKSIYSVYFKMNKTVVKALGQMTLLEFNNSSKNHGIEIAVHMHRKG
jgi:hypothetical protein